MAVYIDSMNAKFGKMIVWRMVADSREELLRMAEKIGLNPKWIQKKGTWEEHFDVCAAKKSKALALGARAVTMMELGRMIAKRPNSPFPQKTDQVPENIAN